MFAMCQVYWKFSTLEVEISTGNFHPGNQKIDFHWKSRTKAGLTIRSITIVITITTYDYDGLRRNYDGY